MSYFTCARTFSTTTALKGAIQNVTIIGGGSMGAGIAQIAAQSGNRVTLVEVNEDLLKNAELRIIGGLKRAAKKLTKDHPTQEENFVEETRSRIRGLTSPVDGVKDADLVLEAIVENLEKKQQLFKELDRVAAPKTIFASNTSSLLIREIASLTNRKDKFGGLHFFNPVPVMKLLEVVRTPETTDETHQALMQWGKSIGKVCITCKDTPGFVVNRLLVPALAEAVRMYERGDATLQDIDTALKLGAGYPMGPFELGDYCGHDVTLSVLEGWHKKFPDNPLFQPPEVLKQLVAEKKLGMKTGEGFYKYTQN